MRARRTLALCALCLSIPAFASAAWSPGGTRIAARAGGVVAPAAQGGLFAATAYPDFFTTVFAADADGATMPGWSATGRELTPGMTITEHNTIQPIQMLPSGDGGCYVLTMEQVGYQGSGGFLYPLQYFVHRRTASGEPAPGWPARGTLVSSPVIDHNFEVRHLPTMTADGHGGVLIAWLYNLYAIDFSGASLFVQRIDAEGHVRWGDDGLQVHPGPDIASVPSLVADGRGGALVFWAQYDAARTQLHVMAQHVKATGTALWEPRGRTVSAGYARIDQTAPPDGGWVRAFYTSALAAVPDGHGGAIVAWAATQTGALDVRAARITRDGTLPWHGDRVLCDAPGEQASVAGVSTGSQGAVFAWRDARAGADVALRAQLVSLTGHTRWTRNGALVAQGPGDRGPFEFVPDERDGFYFGWSDVREGGMVFAQRMLGNGRRARGWPRTGLLVSRRATGDPDFANAVPVHMARGARGSAFVTWSDALDGTLAMRLTPNGPDAAPGSAPEPILTAGTSAPVAPASRTLVFALQGASPNPVVSSAVVRFTLPVAGRASLELLDVSGRRVWTSDAMTLAPGEHVLPLAEGRRLSAGVYLLRLTQGTRAATRRVVVLP